MMIESGVVNSIKGQIRHVFDTGYNEQLVVKKHYGESIFAWERHLEAQKIAREPRCYQRLSCRRFNLPIARHIFLTLKS